MRVCRVAVRCPIISAVSAQNLAEMGNFKVFNDETVGRSFAPDGFSYDEIEAIHISPLHGRAVAVKVSDYEWISVKGGGWNYGGPQIYLSRKDDELVFGLYSAASAERELEVSRKIEEISDEFPKVLYYKRFADYPLPKKYGCILTAKFANGEPVDPCLLYTRVKCPCRVADLMYFTEDEKAAAINFCCEYWGITASEYYGRFTEILARRVGVLHKNGFINDTLDYANVTLLAEIIDYEWVTAPGIKLFDGTYGLQISDERKEKELLYGAEVCYQLNALMYRQCNLFDIYEKFLASYVKVNPQFAKSTVGVRKMLNREEIIL